MDKDLLHALQQINYRLKEQNILNRIEMVEMGYMPLDQDYLRALEERAALDPQGFFLKSTQLIKNAILKAKDLHAGQIRKSTSRKVPYVAHILSVAEIVAKHTSDEVTIVAALLHDTLEDTNYSAQNLKAEFGQEVLDIVLAVSEDLNLAQDKKATWMQRKESYLNNLKNGPGTALFVSAADKIHNLSSMREAYLLEGEALWKNFNAPSDKKIWFYQEVYELIRSKLTHPIVEEFKKELDLAKNQFGL